MGIKSNRFARELMGLIKGRWSKKVAVYAVKPDYRVCERQDGIGAGIGWIGGKRQPHETPSLVKLVHGERCGEIIKSIDRLQVIVMGLPTIRWFAARSFGFGLSDMHCKNRNDGTRNFVLNGKDVFQGSIVTFGPAVGPRAGVDQLCSNADAVTDAADAALKYIVNAEFPPDDTAVCGLALVLEARVPGDHEQFGQAGKLGDDIFRNAIAEVILVLVTRNIRKGKDGNRRLVREGERRSQRAHIGWPLRFDAINVHGLPDVLERLGAEVDRHEWKFSTYLIVRGAGDADFARLRNGLQPGRDVDTVAIETNIVMDHVADVNANPEVHL